MNPEHIGLRDQIYYYDRWWKVVECRWDDDSAPELASYSGKDENGNISSNIRISEITEHKSYATIVSEKRFKTIQEKKMQLWNRLIKNTQLIQARDM